MKTIAVTISLITVSAMTLFGQGRVLFNNLVSGNTITVGGFGGPNAGANYSIQLLWAPVGTYTETAFYAATLGSSAPVQFFGTTGGSPATDGAGLFDGGAVPNPIGTSMPAGNYTMMARAWFNGGQYPTYDAARAASANIGYVIFNQSATAFPAGAPNTIFPSFVIGIPEPSTFALAGLGAACLLLFRRRKQRHPEFTLK